MEERFLILLKMSPLCLASWLQQISSSPGTMSSSGGNPRLCAVPACVSSPVLTQGQLAMAEQCVVKGRSGRSLPQSEIYFFPTVLWSTLMPALRKINCEIQKSEIQ